MVATDIVGSGDVPVGIDETNSTAPQGTAMVGNVVRAAVYLEKIGGMSIYQPADSAEITGDRQ
jgi:hypothetical protein